MKTPAPPRRARLQRRDPWFALLAIALVVPSFVLRARGLGEQILGGDELHLLRCIAELTPREILGAVAERDFSIPLALYGRLLSDCRPLTEVMLRGPLLVVGSLAPTLFALGARRFVGPAAALVFGGMVAIHPFFILYSRFLRPYGVCALLSFGALVYADRWHRDGGRLADLTRACLLAALSAWFNLLGLLFAGVLFAGALVRVAVDGPHDARARRLTACALGGLACLALTLLLYAPALSAIVDNVIHGKVAGGLLSREDLWRNATVFVGAPGGLPVALLGISVLVGALLLVVRTPSIALLVGIVVVGHVAMVLLLEPHLLGFSFVLARYCIFVLPVVWMLAASCWTGLVAALARAFGGAGSTPRAALTLVAGLAFPGTWFALGPYRSIYVSPRAYTHHNAYQTFRHLDLWPRGEWRHIAGQVLLAEVPPFYERFDDHPQPLVLEWPAGRGFDQNPLVYYQWKHGLPMKVLATADEQPWGSGRFAFENVVVLRDGESTDLAGAAFVIVHKQFAREILSAIGLRVGSTAEHYRSELVDDVSRRLTELCGEPVHEDPLLRVFRGPGWQRRQR